MSFFLTGGSQNSHGWNTASQEMQFFVSIVIISLKQLMRIDSLIRASKTGNIYLRVVTNMKPAGHMLQHWGKWMVLSIVTSQDREILLTS